MRIFTLLLSVYVLLLTCIPCCAYDSCEEDGVCIENTSTQQHDTGDKKKNVCGTCSPFFCHSCSHCLPEPYIIYPKQLVVNSKPVYNIYPDEYYSKCFSFSWRPPDRISKTLNKLCAFA